MCVHSPIIHHIISANTTLARLNSCPQEVLPYAFTYSPSLSSLNCFYIIWPISNISSLVCFSHLFKYPLCSSFPQMSATDSLPYWNSQSSTSNPLVLLRLAFQCSCSPILSYWFLFSFSSFSLALCTSHQHFLFFPEESPVVSLPFVFSHTSSSFCGLNTCFRPNLNWSKRYPQGICNTQLWHQVLLLIFHSYGSMFQLYFHIWFISTFSSFSTSLF